MKQHHRASLRVLGIAPTSRGFGFALMIGADILIDWGVKTVKGNDKNIRSISKLTELIKHYKPDVLALENPESSRRGPRIQLLREEIVALAHYDRIKVAQYSREQVKLGLSCDQRLTKHGLAVSLANRFPKELGFRLPLKRRLWTSESYQMDIFEAVAFAQHCLNLFTEGGSKDSIGLSHRSD